MKYIQVAFKLNPVDPFRDMLVYTLGEEGAYDCFVELSDGLEAYVPKDLFDENELKNVISDNCCGCQVSFIVSEMEDKNWNEEWERQHQPVWVEADNASVWVRAPFHDHRADASYEIEIEPKMSFGTAHHPTTRMMLRYLTKIDIDGLDVLDMGCGTAILAILAAKRNAAYVEGIDIDEWAYNNALENMQRNGVDVCCRIGDASLLDPGMRCFDVIVANINRNILMHDMPLYCNVLKPGGTLLLSGFYTQDVNALVEVASREGLSLVDSMTENGWSALRLVR